MWANPQETADLVTHTEEILDGKLYSFVQCQHTKARKTQETVSFQQKFNKHVIFLIYLAFTFLFSQKTKANEVNEQIFFIQSSSCLLMFFKIDYL